MLHPQPLARELALQMTGPRIIDRCAGNGALAFATYHRHRLNYPNLEITCVENNPGYVKVDSRTPGRIIPVACRVTPQVRVSAYGPAHRVRPFRQLPEPYGPEIYCTNGVPGATD